jgi:glycosyltransferase involved in cell wall biosynthesis
MRVVFVNQSGDALGGAEQSLLLLLRALPKDIDAQAIVFTDGAFAQRLRELGIAPHVARIPDSITKTKRERIGTSGVLSVPSSVHALSGSIAALKTDIVYTNTVKAHLLAAPAARLARARCIAHLRDILEGPARLAIRTVLAICTKQRIAISAAVRDAFALPKTSVIPNPLDLAAYETLPTRAESRRELGLPEDGILVSIVGRINRWKGHDRFIRAAAAIADREDVHFAIVGAPIFRDADFMDDLRGQAYELGLADRVRFVPWLDDPRVAYAASDIICNTSHNEPFGRTLIEAAACGIPAICFNSGGTTEAVIDGETGYVVPDRDETLFAERLRRLVDDRALRERLSNAARAFSRGFDAVTHARRVTQVLRCALA